MGVKSIRNNRAKQVVQIASLFAVVSIHSITLATQVIWANTSSDGNWSDASKWSPAVVPNVSNDVLLPDGNEKVIQDQNVSIGNLSIGLSARLNNQDSYVFNASSVENFGSFYLYGGTSAISGNFDNHAVFGGSFINGATFNINGTLNNYPAGFFTLITSAPMDTTVNINHLNNQGLIGIATGSRINITGGGAGISNISGTEYYDIHGPFDVVNSGVHSPVFSHVNHVDGSLLLYTGDYAWDDLTIGPIGTLLIGGTAHLKLKSLRNEYAAGAGFADIDIAENSSLITIGTGTPTISSGWQLFSDSLLTMVLKNELGDESRISCIGSQMVLDGTLNIELLPTLGFVPVPGESFKIIEANPGTLSGQFSSVLGEPFPGGYWQVNYDNLNGNVSVTALTLPEPACLGLLGSLALFGLRRNNRNN